MRISDCAFTLDFQVHQQAARTVKGPHPPQPDGADASGHQRILIGRVNDKQQPSQYRSFVLALQAFKLLPCF
jgi:hypothetical protein